MEVSMGETRGGKLSRGCWQMLVLYVTQDNVYTTGVLPDPTQSLVSVCSSLQPPLSPRLPGGQHFISTAYSSS